MIRFVLSSLGGIFSWIVTALAFVALTIGGIFYMYSRNLPSHEQLAQYTPKTISRIYSGEGRLIDEFAQERRIFVPIQDIPDIVKEAFVSAEDQNFYIHKGYDAQGMLSAAFAAIKSGGKDMRGASTITQQVMKNFLLDGSRSAERKIKELILATRVEQALSKDRILELYLNEIFLGQNSYGVAAAAQTYFNKPLTELTISEAAYLAALPKKPAELHPVRNYEEARLRRNYVLRRLFEDGHITQTQMEAQQATELRTVQRGDYQPFREALPPRDYFTDEIRRQLSKSFGQDEFFGGGLTIRATVDPKLQRQAAKALQEALEKYDRGQGVWRGTGVTIASDQLGDEASWRAALAAVPTDKAPRDVEGWHPAVVLALTDKDARIGIEGVEETAGGQVIPAADVTWARKRLADGKLGPRAKRASDLVEVGDVVLVRAVTAEDGSFQRWSLRQVPIVGGAFVAMDVHTGRVLAMQGGFSYQSSVFNRATQAMRQPGSNFKPFVYAAALDSGFSPETIVVDAPIEVDTPQGLWKPKNASNKYYGPTPLRTGLEQSRNLMTVRIAQEVGMDVVAGYAERFGVYDPMGQFLANSLGSQETTMYKLISAYAMFANGGQRVEPTLVDRVQDRWGRTIYRHDATTTCPDCDNPNLAAGLGPRVRSDREQVINAITAYQMISLMEGAVKRGTGTGVHLPVPVAGKTGTTNDAKDVWFTGFTSNIVASCYMGYDQPRTLGPGAYGGTLCVPVFNDFMQEAVKDYGGTAFKAPPGGYWQKYNRFTGEKLPDDATGDFVQAEYLREGQEMRSLGQIVDGGFAMGENLPLFAQGETDNDTTAVTTATGAQKVIPKKATFGSLSAGGLY